MDEKQHADITKALDKVVYLLRAILIALCAILGLLWVRSR